MLGGWRRAPRSFVSGQVKSSQVKSSQVRALTFQGPDGQTHTHKPRKGVRGRRSQSWRATSANDATDFTGHPAELTECCSGQNQQPSSQSRLFRSEDQRFDRERELERRYEGHRDSTVVRVDQTRPQHRYSIEHDGVHIARSDARELHSHAHRPLPTRFTWRPRDVGSCAARVTRLDPRMGFMGNYVR